MQRHVKRKFENALSIGVIALLLILLLFTIGHDINTRAIYEEKGEVLSPETGTGLGFIVVITIVSILFALFVLDFIISGGKFNEEEERKLRAFAARCRGRGYSREETVTLLGKHGWKQNKIENYLD